MGSRYISLLRNKPLASRRRQLTDMFLEMCVRTPSVERRDFRDRFVTYFKVVRPGGVSVEIGA